MSDNDAIESVRKIPGLRDVRKVREATRIVVSHVHATIEPILFLMSNSNCIEFRFVHNVLSAYTH